MALTMTPFTSGSSNQSLINRSECPSSETSTFRSRITLSQNPLRDRQLSLMPQQSNRFQSNNAFNNYTPMSANSTRSRSSATINTPFTTRTYSTPSLASNRTISPVIVKLLKLLIWSQNKHYFLLLLLFFSVDDIWLQAL
jgi:hypothetical protein